MEVISRDTQILELYHSEDSIFVFAPQLVFTNHDTLCTGFLKFTQNDRIEVRPVGIYENDYWIQIDSMNSYKDTCLLKFHTTSIGYEKHLNYFYAEIIFYSNFKNYNINGIESKFYIEPFPWNENATIEERIKESEIFAKYFKKYNFGKDIYCE
ncbi:MAG: hypothetical protein H7X71_00415 [Chitinophagales bacterium]|nr:hypothetical protein [Chitinophagales bacterium]